MIKSIKSFSVVLIYLTTGLLYSQNNDETIVLANQILADRIIKIDEAKLLSKQRRDLTEGHLRDLVFLKSKKFSDGDNPDNQITLTEEEGKYIVKSIRADYDWVWTEKEIKKTPILKSDDVRTYMNGDNKRNALIVLSKPVFIRNGEIAIVYYGNFVYSKEFGYTDLCFYIKKNGIWKKWIVINEFK